MMTGRTGTRSLRFLTKEQVKKKFKGKTVAIVGSGPSVTRNKPGYVDSHDIVVRVNNYKLSRNAGYRTDVHYSFYGVTVKKSAKRLKEDGVYLCMSKCPNSKPIHSPWHERLGKVGTDFRNIYERRKNFWFCDTYITSEDQFLEYFNLLGKHVPTTGFQAILEISGYGCESIYITGFDFFTSKIHNVDEKWRPGHPDDPIGHRPKKELKWLKKHQHQFVLDKELDLLLQRTPLP
jgi:hypothetical protein